MKILFDKIKKQFYTVSSYQEKDIPKGAGFWWDATSRRWWTNDVKKAAKLAGYADEAAKEILDSLFQKREEKIAASKAIDAVIDVPANSGLEYLPFQKAGISFSINRKNTLIADEMGLGKTIQAIGVINFDKNIKSVLIVCPASLKINWKRECEKWLVEKRQVVILNTSSEGIVEGVNIVNYDIIEKLDFLKNQEWDLLILDEAHYVKNYKAKRTIHLLGGKKKVNGQEVKIEGIKAKKKIFLTGTPILNRPIELWSIVSALGFQMDFWRFVKRYCGATQTRYGWDLTGASNLEELQEKLRTSVMVRRLKADVLKELPAKRRQVVELSLNGNGLGSKVKKEQELSEKFDVLKLELQAKRDLAETEEEYLKAVEALTELSQYAFTEISKIRHEVAIEKIPSVISFVEDTLENTDKVVVFCHHLDVVDALIEKLGDKAVKLVGGMSDQQRQLSVDRFQSDDSVRVFVGTIKAAGVGITLTKASTVIFAELDWVPANLTQAEDRCHRIGQVNSVNVYHLVVDGSIDAKLAKTVVEKQEVIDRGLDKELGQVEVNLSTVEIEKQYEYEKGFKKEVEKISDELKGYILSALKGIAFVCDGAQREDRVGFNKYDVVVGHSLADKESLSDRQALLGKKVLKKYKKQIAEDVYEKIFYNDSP